MDGASCPGGATGNSRSRNRGRSCEITTRVWEDGGEWYYETTGLPQVEDGYDDLAICVSIALRDAVKEHNRAVTTAPLWNGAPARAS